MRDLSKAKLLVETVGVPGDQVEAPKILQTRMGVDESEDGFGEALSAGSLQGSKRRKGRQKSRSR